MWFLARWKSLNPPRTLGVESDKPTQAVPAPVPSMRLATLLSLVAASLLMLPGAALAHLTHDGCSSVTVVDRPIHVDSYQGNCSGITVSVPNAICAGVDVHVGNAHILVIWDWNCQTGVVTEFVDGGALVALTP